MRKKRMHLLVYRAPAVQVPRPMCADGDPDRRKLLRFANLTQVIRQVTCPRCRRAANIPVVP